MAEPYVGEIRMFAGKFAPRDGGFVMEHLISISEYDVLYSLLGTTYGGDGQQTFALPDLRGRLPIGQSGNHRHRCQSRRGNGDAHEPANPGAHACALTGSTGNGSQGEPGRQCSGQFHQGFALRE